MASQRNILISEGFTLHTENSARILLPASNEAFINPVQEFNRDISVACIRVWSEELNRHKEARWKQQQERGGSIGKKRKKSGSADNSKAPGHVLPHTQGDTPANPEGCAGTRPEYRPYKVTILEALSATGLRSIRYAKEIPLVKYVIANDLSSTAVEAMKRNVEFNGLGAPTEGASEEQVSDGPDSARMDRRREPLPSKVRINEGDACTLMYNHRHARVDAVDLDPYGTAAPFIDAAIQCVNDGGLLCVTCTDLAVLATNNSPEKCFANYGGIPLKAEYCHESALRLVLHAISTSAGRYGRYIQPLLSLSIDFYVRLFVRVQTAPIEVKKAVTKTSTFFVCVGCQSFYEQPLGRRVEKIHEGSGAVNASYKTQPGPLVSNRCPECDSVLHLAGPMWSAPLHDADFVGKVLGHLEGGEHQYGTLARMKGMLTVAKEELDTHFFFTPSRIASFFHCPSPSLDEVASALLHAGYKVSRSHITGGSLKTTASRADVHDLYRSWVKLHPVKMDKLPDCSPARRLLVKEPKTLANFSKHPEWVAASSQVKLVRYQQNPTANWGPGSKAIAGTGRKRKRAKDEDEGRREADEEGEEGNE